MDGHFFQLNASTIISGKKSVIEATCVLRPGVFSQLWQAEWRQDTERVDSGQLQLNH